MAKAGNILDNYSQFAVLNVAGVAATTGTVVEQLVTGITNMQKVAWEVGRIEYLVPLLWVAYSRLAAYSDYITFGVTQSGSATQVVSGVNPSIIDFVNVGAGETLSNVGYKMPLLQPIVHAFHDPILMLPQNIFGVLRWVTTTAIDATGINARIWYKEIELGPADWYDLLQLRLPLGAT